MTTASTPLGDVRGITSDRCERYLGIRYAKAPVGASRFAPPVPVEPWEGVYDATSFGPGAPQPTPEGGGFGIFGTAGTSEDCLFLNVYTPNADDATRPVMVWIHGGAYTIGSAEMYDGTTLATRGDVVVVTLNYRLGVLGWIPLDHLDPSLAGSGNNGVRDQITALRWVRDNIASFGGDPNNVTIFGESAGGGSISAIIAAPDGDGLYHKAIIQSGAPGLFPPVGAAGYTADVLSAIGEPGGGIDALRAAPVEKLIEAQMSIGAFARLGRDPEHPIAGPGPGPHPVVDGVVVTRTPAEAIAQRRVPLIIGTNTDEGTLFAALLATDATDDEFASALPAGFDDPGAVVAAYRAIDNGRSPIVDLMTDGVFRIPSLRVADAAADAGMPVWVYLFTWATPVFGGILGATHALELPFVWGQLDDATWKVLVGDAPPNHLATAMQGAWLAFARTGDPNTDAIGEWPIYDTASRPTLEFGDAIRVMSDPGGELRRLWYSDAERVRA